LQLTRQSRFHFVIAPQGPEGPPAAHTPAEEPTVERGEYLAKRVASCAGCHSKRNPMDGSYVGERFAGGGVMPRETNPSHSFVTPNLTPDSATGHIYRWSEEQFVARFRAGRVYPDTHMPWTQFGRMSDTDLRAIYRNLRSLRPIANPTGALIQPTSR
jgi:mono/diheme cytochrome c family protein